MATPEPLSRGGLTSRAGLSEDIMTTWNRGGLFAPLPRRTPTARRAWPWHDANIAAIMIQLREFGVPLDGMIEIAAIFRKSITWMEQYGLSHDEVPALWNYFNIKAAGRRSADAAQDAEEVLQLFRHERHGKDRVTERIEELATRIDEQGFRQHLDAFLTITELPKSGEARARFQPDVSYFWRSGGHWRFARGEDGPAKAREEGALATIAIDVATIIYDVWHKPEVAREICTAGISGLPI